MSLTTDFRPQLQALTTGGPQAIVLDDDGKHLECRLFRADILACELEKLSLQTGALAGATMDELKKISEALTKRVTYLLEPIGPVEYDDQQCTIQMRSKPPQQDDDGSAYYELLVSRGGELTVCRYRKQPGNVRQVIPATLTREVLCRLVEDFEAVLEA